MNNIPRIPLGEWVDSFVASLYRDFEGLFRGFSYIIGGFVDLLTNFLTIIPAIVMIIILCFLIWYTTRKLSLVIFTLIGLLFILNINYWAQTMQTLALVLTSVIISIIMGTPIGILASQNERFSKFLKPTLDFMQTMPAFSNHSRDNIFWSRRRTRHYCFRYFCYATDNQIYRLRN